MPREGLPLGTCTLPMSSGTSLIVHESGAEDDPEGEPPPPPPDVAQNDLMMRLGLLLGKIENLDISTSKIPITLVFVSREVSLLSIFVNLKWTIFLNMRPIIM